MGRGWRQPETQHPRGWSSQVVWPALPLAATCAFMISLRLEWGEGNAAALAVLLSAAIVSGAIVSAILKGQAARIAGTSLISAAAAIAYMRYSGLDVLGSVGLFVACLTVLILSCAVLASARRRAMATEELAALLLFEGEVASRSAREARNAVCRALLALAQRSDRPFSILRLEWDAPTALESETMCSSQSAGKRINEHMLRFETITRLEQAVRSSDVVLPAKQRNSVYVACPDTDAAGARVLSERIVADLPSATGASLTFASASFPSEGYHLEELIAAADKRGRSWSAADAGRVPGHAHTELRGSQTRHAAMVDVLGPTIQRHSASRADRDNAHAAPH